MDIFLWVMSATLLGWLIWNAVYCSRTLKALISKDGFIMHVKCKKCGMEYEVPVEEFLKHNYSRQKLGGASGLYVEKIQLPRLRPQGMGANSESG